MKTRNILLAMVLIAFFLITPTMATNGPKTDNLLIHVYNDPDTEFAAMQAHEIDITDWPLSSTWVTAFTADPSIGLRSYAELGKFEVDINCQKWPTGVETPREYDPESDSYKHYFDDGGTPGVMDTPDEMAVEFRKAINHLTNKDDIVSDIMKGYGSRHDSPLAFPASAAYIPSDAAVYDYDPALAASTLDAAGFTQGTTPNPNYDPLTPGSAQYMRTDPLAGGADLQTLKMWIRLDDPNRKEAGLRLGTQMKKAGIPVAATVSERTVCYNNVMVLYDYHLYTGGWSLTPDAADDLHGLYHSSQYWGGNETSSMYGMGWSSNYPGFCDHEFDSYAETAKYGQTFEVVRDATFDGVRRYQELIPLVDMYSFKAVKAFDSAWSGVVNYESSGIDNGWSFLAMNHATDNTIDWGFKSNLESLNDLTAEWLWDSLALGRVYEAMLDYNPYNLADETGMLAEEWTPLTIMSSGPSAGLAYIDFALRAGMTFHGDMDGIPGRDPVRPRDVKFSLEFKKAAGPGVTWGYTNYATIDHVETQAENASLGAQDVRVFFVSGVQSYWALHWAGFAAIYSEAVWMAANANYGWGYVYGETDFNNFPNREMIRNYQPSLSDQDSDGIVDLAEDGAGAWIFVSMDGATPSVSTSFAFAADNVGSYCLSQAYVGDYLGWAFWATGDTTRNNVVDIVDASKIANAIVGGYDADANIAPYPYWDEVTGTGYPDPTPVVNAEDLGKWGRATRFVFPRDT